MKGGSYGCSAVQHGDQNICDKCGLCWDMSDTDPPNCLTPGNVRRENFRVNMAKLRAALDLPHVSP